MQKLIQASMMLILCMVVNGWSEWFGYVNHDGSGYELGVVYIVGCSNPIKFTGAYGHYSFNKLDGMVVGGFYEGVQGSAVIDGIFHSGFSLVGDYYNEEIPRKLPDIELIPGQHNIQLQ